MRGSDREAAEEVRRLRKPSLPAWAINVLSLRGASSIQELLSAGDELRAAQESALGGAQVSGLKEAAVREREAVNKALEDAAELLGPEARAPTLERIRATLHGAALDGDIRQAIMRGRLTRDYEPVGLGPLVSAPAAPSGRPRAGDRAAKGDADRARSAAARAELRAAEKADRGSRRKLEAAQRELAKRREDAERAQRRLAEAQRESDAAEAEAQRAAERLQAAQRAGQAK